MSILLLTIVFELIRTRRLKEEYSLLWLLSGVVILIFSIFPKMLDLISRIMGTYYLTTMLIISFLFLLLIVLHFSTVISQLSKKNKELTQELSIMDYKFRELDKQFHDLVDKL
ncbi:MAG: DUF2304 domain-containing protein [Sedimentisphaerales bacterium]|nr:DUF2304 domain-containing protein [Sedimentisphaerales bacterium]